MPTRRAARRGQEGVIEARLSLPPVPASAAAARRFTAANLSAWGCYQLVDVVVLLVSELVTNAVLHARSVIDVVLVPAQYGVRAEVHDRNPVLPVPRHYEAEAMTGRGLAMVAELSAKWGVTELSDGKAVWFEVVTDSEMA